MTTGHAHHPVPNPSRALLMACTRIKTSAAIITSPAPKLGPSLAHATDPKMAPRRSTKRRLKVALEMRPAGLQKASVGVGVSVCMRPKFAVKI